MRCPNCHADNPSDAAFCTQCGTPLGGKDTMVVPASADPEATQIVSPGTCANCGALLQPGMPFCSACGAPVSDASPAEASSSEQPQSDPLSDRSLHMEEISFYQNPLGETVPVQPSASGEDVQFCTQCGAKNSINQTHCTQCGALLASAAPADFAGSADSAAFAASGRPVSGSVCPACGSPVAPGSDFCTECGTSLKGMGQGSAGSVLQNQTGVPGSYGQPGIKKAGSMKRILWPVLSVACFAACAVGSQMMLNSTFTPQKTAEAYFTSLCNGDYEKAFAMLEAKETDFINAEAFRNVDASLNLGKVTNFSVRPAGMESTDATGLGTAFEVVYRSSGDTEDSTYDLTLNKSLEKKYLFFDDWAVGYSDLVSRNVTVQVPKDSAVSMNGIALDASLKKETDDIALDTYVIPEIFNGLYNVEIQKPGFDATMSSVTIGETDQRVVLSSMTLSEDNAKQLQQQALKDVNAIYAAAMNGSPFTSVASLFTGDSASLKDIQNAYNRLRTALSKDNVVYKLDLSDVRAFSETSESGVNLNFDYAAEFSSATGSGKKRTDDGTIDTYLSYQPQEDGWVLNSFPSLYISLW